MLTPHIPQIPLETPPLSTESIESDSTSSNTLTVGHSPATYSLEMTILSQIPHRFRPLVCFFLTLSIGLLVAPWAARAATITDVADAADHISIGDYQESNPFDFWFGPEFEFLSASGKITREPGSGCLESNARDCLPVDELQWAQTQTKMNFKMQAGIYHDLALTLKIPVIFGDSRKFDYAGGVTASNSSIDPDNGNPEETLFNHNYSSNHKGLDDIELGLRYAPLSDIRDESKPNWVVFINWAIPRGSKVYNPTEDSSKSDKPVGDGVHRTTFGTSLSKRVGSFGLVGIDDKLHRRGYLDPYMEFSYTLPVPEQDLANRSQVKTGSNSFGTPPSHTAKVQAGVEIVPVENIKKQQKFAVDLRFVSEYHSEGRNFSILTDPLGELTYTEQFVDIGAQAAIVGQPHRFVQLMLGFSVDYRTEHFVTSENIGRDGDGNGVVDDVDVDEFNPYFCGNDADDSCGAKGIRASESYDQIGFRFKNEEHVFWTIFSGISITL